MSEKPAAVGSPGPVARAAGAPTIKDIATHLGISYATVSRALNDHRHTSQHVKARVAAAAAELGYVPHVGARMMRAQRSRIVGLVMPDLSNQIFVGTAAILAEHCRKAGYQLVLSISNRDAAYECELVEALIQVHAAGIVIAPCGDTLERTRALLRQVPCVQLGDRNPDLAVPTMAVNDREAAREATRHLVQLGHRRIAYLGGAADVRTHNERLAGYREALADAEIADIGEELVLTGPVTVAFGRISMARLLGCGVPPTAVMVSNSTLTKGVLEMVREARVSVPDEISIVGFGDLDWFHLWGPGLTTVDLPIDELAQAAALHLFEHIPLRGPFEPPQPFIVPLPARLVVRGSTAPPKAPPNVRLIGRDEQI